MCGGGSGGDGGHGQPAGPAGESQARTVEAITARNRASFDRLEARLNERGGLMGSSPLLQGGGTRLTGFEKVNRIERLRPGQSITVGQMTVARRGSGRFVITGPRGFRRATMNATNAAVEMPDTGW